MDRRRQYALGIVIIFALAIALRVLLSLANTEANDDHLAVMKIMIDDHRIPHGDDCWECYHPKLFYLLCVFLYRLFPVNLLATAQFVALLSGIALLFLAYSFLGRTVSDPRIKFITLALVAFNPQLIAISAQPSNDSLAILLASAAVYAFYLYVIRRRTMWFVGGTAALICALLTKTTATPVFVAVAAVFPVSIVIAARRGMRYRTSVAALLCFLVLVVSFAAVFGEYRYAYAAKGDPFAINIVQNPWPTFIGENVYDKQPLTNISTHSWYFSRPGVTSVVNSYLTFGIVDLVRHPVITTGFEPEPWHRTSLWTQLYGQLHFAQYPSWPASWATNNDIMLNAGRLAYLLGLVPLAIFLLGLYAVLLDCYRNRRHVSFFIENQHWMFVVLLFAHLGFIVLVTARYWDFSAMKLLYVLPGLLSVIAIFSVGLKQMFSFIVDNRARFVLYVIIGLLLSCYVFDILVLIAQVA